MKYRGIHSADNSRMRKGRYYLLYSFNLAQKSATFIRIVKCINSYEGIEVLNLSCWNLTSYSSEDGLKVEDYTRKEKTILRIYGEWECFQLSEVEIMMQLVSEMV